jgi:hypothetical protein
LSQCKTQLSEQFVNLQDGTYIWQIFRNADYDCRKLYTPTGWWAAEQKSKAQVADLAGLKAALAWHFRHTVVKCWCTEEIKSQCFSSAGADAWFAQMYIYGDCEDEHAGPSDSGYSSE